MIALTFFAVSMHQALSTDDGTEIEMVNATTSDGIADVGTATRIKLDGANDWEFILAYLVELALSYFLWYPLIGTVLFSGALTCGKYFQMTGGRPYEIARNELEAAEEGRSAGEKKQSSTDGNTKKAASSKKATSGSSNNNKKKNNLKLPQVFQGKKKNTGGGSGKTKKPTKAPVLPSNTKR